MRGGLVSRHVAVDGLRWHFRVGGPLDAPPLVMPHGLVISSRYLVPLARRFVRTHRVYLPDFPGFGRSAKRTHAWDVPDMAAGLARWMDAEGVPRAAFAANSLGCQVAVELAARMPDRVERAVLVGPTMDPSLGAWAHLWRLAKDAPREHPLLPLEHVPDYLRAGIPRAVRTYLHALRHPMLDRAPRVRCPVLVVRGTRDPLVRQAWALRLTRAFPDARYVEVPGAHALNYSHPRRLERAIRGFIRGDASQAMPEARTPGDAFHSHSPQSSYPPQA